MSLSAKSASAPVANAQAMQESQAAQLAIIAEMFRCAATALAMQDYRTSAQTARLEGRHV